MNVHILKGDRIAQVVFHSIVKPVVFEVTDLEQTRRGEYGFGSTDALYRNKINLS